MPYSRQDNTLGSEQWGYQTLQGREVRHPVVFPPATLSIKGHCGQECLLNTCADAIWPFIACLPRMFFLEFRLSCHGDQPNCHCRRGNFAAFALVLRSQGPYDTLK